MSPRDPVEVLVAVIRDDLHVKRLRQIWDAIADRVDRRPDSGGNILAFPPLIAGVE